MKGITFTSTMYTEQIEQLTELGKACSVVRRLCDKQTAIQVHSTFDTYAYELADKLGETADKCEAMLAATPNDTNLKYIGSRFYEAIGRFNRARNRNGVDEFADTAEVLDALSGLEFFIKHYLEKPEEPKKAKKAKVDADAPTVEAPQPELAAEAAKLLDS